MQQLEERIFHGHLVVQSLTLIVIAFDLQMIDDVGEEMSSFHFTGTLAVLQAGEVNVQMIERRGIVEEGSDAVRRNAVLRADQFLEPRQQTPRCLRTRERETYRGLCHHRLQERNVFRLQISDTVNLVRLDQSQEMQGLDALAIPREVGEKNVFLAFQEDSLLFGFAVDDVVHPLSVELVLLDVRTDDRLVLLVGFAEQCQLLLRILLDVRRSGRIDVRQFNLYRRDSFSC